MIVLHKKQILVTLTIIAVSIIAIAVGNVENGNDSFLPLSKGEKNELSRFSAVQTVALPVSNKTIVIDAGHRSAR